MKRGPGFCLWLIVVWLCAARPCAGDHWMSGGRYDANGNGIHDSEEPSYYYYYCGGFGLFLFIVILVCMVWALQFPPGGAYPAAYPHQQQQDCYAPSAPPRNVIALRIDRRYMEAPDMQGDASDDARQRLVPI